MSQQEPAKHERPWTPLLIVLGSAALLLVVGWFVVGSLFGRQIENIDLVGKTATKYVQAALDGDIPTMTELGRTQNAALSHPQVSEDLRQAVGQNGKAVILGVNSKQIKSRFEYQAAVSIKGSKASHKVAVTVLVIDDAPQVVSAEIRD